MARTVFEGSSASGLVPRFISTQPSRTQVLYSCGMHILVAEDNTVNQRLLTRLLQRLGCTISIAINGQEALNYLSASPATHPRPDIILMDTAMPVMGGIEATNILRTQPPFASDTKISTTPIIAMTPSNPRIRGEAKQWLRNGFDDVLPKPVRPVTLRQMMLYWSRRRIFPRQGSPSAAGTENIVPIPAGLVPWGPSLLRRYKGPRSLL
ncbi:CheY-like superfamily [Aspergillus navahoensis]